MAAEWRRAWRLWCLLLAYQTTELVGQASTNEEMPICPAGLLQKDLLVLGCQPRRINQTMLLTAAKTTGDAFYWRASKGVQALRIEAHLEVINGYDQSASLTLQCLDGSQEVLVGPQGSYLNCGRTNLRRPDSTWAWSGCSQSNEGVMTRWLTVTGGLPCDASFVLQNEGASSLLTSLHVAWLGIQPCPLQPLGCDPCPLEGCGAGEAPVCDGSTKVRCLPAEDVDPTKSGDEGTFEALGPEQLPKEKPSLTFSGSLSTPAADSVQMDQTAEEQYEELLPSWETSVRALIVGTVSLVVCLCASAACIFVAISQIPTSYEVEAQRGRAAPGNVEAAGSPTYEPLRATAR